MDKINIDGMEFYGYHGCLPEENRLGQKFFVDLELALDLRQAGQTDDLSQTINYAEVYAEIKKIVEGKAVNLIECLGENIAKMVLDKFPLTEAVKVKIHKPGAPIAGAFRDVSVTIERESITCYLSLGSNLGDRKALISQALTMLKENKNTCLLNVSSFYETPPWGNEDQPAFINCAAKIKFIGTAIELLDLCQEIELALGRERKIHWGPRTVDIDLLCTNNSLQINDDRLKIPHPYMLERSFVLLPLSELAPDLKIKGKSINAYLSMLDDRDNIIKL